MENTNQHTTVLYSNATIATPGAPVNIYAADKVTVQVIGTSNSSTVNFQGSLDGVNFAPIELNKLGDSTVAQNNTAGVGELWQLEEVGNLQSFMAPLANITNGAVTVIVIVNYK